MKHTALSLAVASALLGMGTALAEPVTTENTDLVISTQGGLKVETVDKKFAFKLGARIQADQNLFEGGYNFSTSDPDEVGDWADNLFFRRTRIELEGTAYYDWKYQFVTSFDESNNSVALEDVWLGYSTLRHLDIDGLARVGKFKPYFALEELTSSKWIPFIERSTPDQFFAAGRKVGFGAQAPFLDMFTIGSSYFRESIGGNGDGGDLHGYSARGTYSPWHEDGKVLHFGAAWQTRELMSDRISVRQQIRASDQVRSPVFAGGSQQVDLDVVGLEGLGIFGPFSLTGEYYTGWLDPRVDQAGNDELDVWGFYVAGRWTITGEYLPYSFKDGAPGQIKPIGPWGALELVARYSTLEIEDFFEASIDQFTVGFNWYINKNVKFAVNYEHTELDGDSLASLPEDEGHGIALRAQYQF